MVAKARVQTRIVDEQQRRAGDGIRAKRVGNRHLARQRGLGAGRNDGTLGKHARRVDEGDDGSGGVQQAPREPGVAVERVLRRGIEQRRCVHGGQTRLIAQVRIGLGRAGGLFHEFDRGRFRHRGR